MSVTGIGGTAGTAPQSKDATGKTQSPEETFLAIVKKSPWSGGSKAGSRRTA